MRSGRPTRDSFLDVVRAFAILAVVAEHWLIPVLGMREGELYTGNALATPGWWPLTWLSQVMPLVFFAGGAANVHSLRRAKDTRTWLATRVRRLLVPVLPLVAVWVPLPMLLRAAGVAEQPLEVIGTIPAQLLWFLGVYLLVILVTPMLLTAHRRFGLLVPAVFAVAAVLVDLARFSGHPMVGYVNAGFVWLAVHQLGFHYVDGMLAELRGRMALAMSATGFGATALLVAAGSYPASMVGLPGEPMSNMGPPTAVLLTLAVGQLGLLLSLRNRLDRLARLRPVDGVLTWLGARFMTVYLWHMPALVLVGTVTVVGFGYTTPDPGSAEWFAAIPGWLAMVSAVAYGALRLFARFEVVGGRCEPTRWLPLGAPAAAAGVLGLCAVGFTAPANGGPLDGPLPWIALLLLGFRLSAGVRTVEQRERSVVQDPAQERVPEPLVGSRPAGDGPQLHGVVVGNVGEVGTEHDPVGDRHETVRPVPG